MIEVEIADPAWTEAAPEAEALAVRAAEAALARCGRDAAACEVAILLTDDAALADLNRRFRGKAGPTNVLSFPALANTEGRQGDVALAYGVCAAEALAQGKPLADHLSHLVAHGVLHLLGYDHETDAEAETMEALERAILAPLGVPDPYAADSAGERTSP